MADSDRPKGEAGVAAKPLRAARAAREKADIGSFVGRTREFPPHLQVGREFLWQILALIIFVLALISAYAWFTYIPLAVVLSAPTGDGAAATLQDFQAQQKIWFEQVTGLAQLLLVGPLLPLLGALIGQMLSRRGSS